MSTKSQTFFTDFIIALLLFSFTLIVYFGYTINLHGESKDELELMIRDANSISNSLTLSGYPEDWTAQSVIRYGIADNQRINSSKIRMMKQSVYQDTRSKFSTPYDYFAFFVNDEGEVINVNGICGIGSPIISTSYESKSAYYYSDSSKSEFKSFMEQSLGSDSYFDDISNLAANLSKYSLVVMENPSLTSAELGTYKTEIEDFIDSGNHLIVSGQLSQTSGDSLLGAEFYEKAGQAVIDRNSTANFTDQYLELGMGENLVFENAYYTQNLSAAKNYAALAIFNDDNKDAVSRWEFGNGSAYFMSSPSANSSTANFTTRAEDLISTVIEGTCKPINISLMSKQKLVASERYLIYNSKIVKMILYLWK